MARSRKKKVARGGSRTASGNGRSANRRARKKKTLRSEGRGNATRFRKKKTSSGGGRSRAAVGDSSSGSRSSNRSSSRAPVRASMRATGTVVDWRNDAILARMTKRILALDRRVGKHRVDAVVQMGRDLRQVRQRLTHGAWMQWLAEAVPFSHDSARNYVAVTEFAESEPEDFARFEHLGPAKLYAIVRLDDKHRSVLRRRTKHRVPGTRLVLSLDVMSHGQFGAVLTDIVTPNPPKKPIGYFVQSFRRDVASLRNTAKVLVHRRDELDAPLARELVGALREVADTVEDGLD